MTGPDVSPESPDAHAEMDRIRNENRLIRDQIDALQVEAALKHRPWYRNPALILSVIALGVSTGFSGLGLWRNVLERSEDRLSEKVQDVRQLLVELTDLRAQEVRESATMAQNNPALFSTMSSVRNSQRQILLEMTDVALEAIHELASPQMLNAMALEHVMDSRFRRAERYYLRAREMGRDSANAQLVALQGLGGVYMTPGSPIHDLEKGRESFLAAIEILEARSDDYAAQQRAQAYSFLAGLERANGDEGRAAKALAEARAQLEDMSEQNPARHQLEVIFTQFEEGVMTPVSMPVSNAELVGEWVLRYPDGTVGNLQLGLNETTGQGWALVEVASAGRMVRKYEGPWIREGPEQLLVSWQGVRSMGFGNIAPMAGSTRLVLAADADRHRAVEWEVGNQAVTAALARR